MEGLEGRGEYLIGAWVMTPSMLGEVYREQVERSPVPRHMYLAMVNLVVWRISLVVLVQQEPLTPFPCLSEDVLYRAKTVSHHSPPVSSLLSHGERAAFRPVPSPRCPKVEMSLSQVVLGGGIIAVPVMKMD